MNKKKSGLKSRKKVQSKHMKKHQMTTPVHLTRERERERSKSNKQPRITKIQNSQSGNNALLNKANAAKNDEFYTQLTDIEKELKHYKKHFKGKTVLCNCDDPRVSKFFHYFSHNFEELGLKKLITTCYKNKQMNLFSKNNSKQSIYLEYNGDKNNNRVPDPKEIGIFHLKGDGDFQNDECIEILKQADIVVTNPPFSLFRKYVEQLVKYKKKYIIMGNINAITYKETFPLIKNNKMWLGASIHSGDREFEIPVSYTQNSSSLRIDEKGRKFVKVVGIRWFTNLDYQERHEDLILTNKYNPKEYPNYDNYNAINVDKTANIPADYKKVMGVPISFMDKFNPDQFEIIGIDRQIMKELTGKTTRFRLNDKELYARILIKHKRKN